MPHSLQETPRTLVQRLHALRRSLLEKRPSAAGLVDETVELIERQGRRIAFEATLAPELPDPDQLALPLSER